MSEPKTKMTLLLTPAERARLDALRLARGDRSAAATLRALVRDAGGDPPRARNPSGAAMLTIAYDGLAAVVASVLRGYGLTPFCPPEAHARAEEADAAREQALERAGLVKDGEVTEAGKALVARAYEPPTDAPPRHAPPPIPSAPPDPEPMTMAERILEAIRSGRNKRHQIVDYVLHFQRPTKDSVARLLAEMKRGGEITTTGRGRNSTWKVAP